MTDRVVKAASRSRERDQGLASRIAAADILFRVDRESAYADVLLGARLPDFAPADRRLITRIVLGTIAWQARLDYELKRLTRRELISIQPVVLEILRMGLFQLRFLDRIPAHAVVDTAVTIAKRNPQARSAAGFINAVMRQATHVTVPMPSRSRNEMNFLAIAYSHPPWMVERFVEWFGVADAERLMATNNDAAPNVIRLNLARGSHDNLIEKLHADGFEIGADGHALEAIVLKSAPRFESVSYREGLFHPQSEASQLVARMLAPEAGATVVDCAAAPGGKATHLAEMVGEFGSVIALDLNLSGLRHARTLARRLRHRNIDLVRADLTTGAPLAPARFEYVLLDAPCTGLGTLREHPEIKWRLKPGDIARMAEIQSLMLEHAAALVGRGGAIVYSVCSVAPEEGEGVIGEFLTHHADFEIDPDVGSRAELKEFIDPRGFMKTRPDLGGLDGFFAVRLVRR